MKNLNNFNKIEKAQNKSYIFKKILEGSPEQIKKILKIIIVSTMIGFGQAHAQDNDNQRFNKSGVLEDKHKIEWQVNIDSSKKENIEKMIEEQRSWFKDYIQSPKFKERLTKEYLRSHNYPEIYNNYLANSKPSENKDYKDDDTLRIETNPDDTERLAELLPDPDTSNIPISEIEDIEKEINYRLYSLSNGKIYVVDSIEDISLLEGGTVLGSYDIDGDTTKIRADFLNYGTNSVSTHEFSHDADQSGENLKSFTVFIFNEMANSGSEYLNDPTEIQARMNELKYLLKEHGIYDASTEDFTEETFWKMIEDEVIIGNYAIQQLLQTLSKEELIWLMNNVAGLNVSSVNKDMV
ncbi:MAG: hypothetical protein WDK96_00745 [Candidatus Paceibacterota bacterium]|jgi:hypothetical protein